MNKKKKIIIAMITFIVLFNVLSWSSTIFCNRYIEYVFPIWTATLGRFMGFFPFSVGEWLLVIGILMLIFAVIMLIPLLVKKTRRFAKGYYKFFGWTLLFVCLIMSLNNVVMYHVTPFSERYFGISEKEYTPDQLLQLYNDVANKCNELQKKFERDENGWIIFPEDFEENMKDKAILAMQDLGKTYPQLSGFYPKPKPIFFSDFMSQEYLLGIFFPFTLEANYNTTMYEMNLPSTYCHELAHLKGYFFEDEANFISYLACVSSDDIYLQYSGYLSVLYYLEEDTWQLSDEYVKQMVEVDSIVWQDDVFMTPEEWDRIEEDALLETETVSQVADTFLDTNLKVNGVQDGMVSYSQVVKLLLKYYYR